MYFSLHNNANSFANKYKKGGTVCKQRKTLSSFPNKKLVGILLYNT